MTMDPSSHAAALEFTLSWLQSGKSRTASWDFDSFNKAEDVDAHFHCLLKLPYPPDHTSHRGKQIQEIQRQKRAVFHQALQQLSVANEVDLARKAFSALPQFLREFPVASLRADAQNVEEKQSHRDESPHDLPPLSSPPAAETINSHALSDHDTLPATALTNTPYFPTCVPGDNPYNCFGCCEHFLLSSDHDPDPECNVNPSFCCTHPIAGPSAASSKLRPLNNPTLEQVQVLQCKIATLEQRVESQDAILQQHTEFLKGLRKVIRLQRKLEKYRHRLL